MKTKNMTVTRRKLAILVTVLLALMASTVSAFADLVLVNYKTGKGNIASGGSTATEWLKPVNEGGGSGRYSDFTAPKSQAFIVDPEHGNALKQAKDKDGNLKTVYTPFGGPLLSAAEIEARSEFASSDTEIDGSECVAVDPSVSGTIPFGFTAKNCVVIQPTEDGTKRIPVDVRVTVTSIGNVRTSVPSGWNWDDTWKSKRMIRLQKSPTPNVAIDGVSSATVKIEYFESDGTFSTPKTIGTNCSFGDIDCYQKVTFDSGSRITYQLAADDTNLDYSKNGTAVTYNQPYAEREEHDNIPQDAFGVYFDASKITLKYEMGISPHGNEAWAAFFTSNDAPMGDPEPPAPIKAVKDTDEDYTTAEGNEKGITNDNTYNTLGANETSYSYKIEQYIPNIRNSEQWFYDNFVITDEVADGLKITEAKITPETVTYDGNTYNLSDYFNISISNSGKKVTATAKDSWLSKKAAYDRFYALTIKVKVDRAALGQYASTNFTKDTYQPGAWSKKTSAEYGTSGYNVVGWEAGKKYIIVPNKASTLIDSGKFTARKGESNLTRTFIEMPTPDEPIKSVKDSNEGFDEYNTRTNTLTTKEKTLQYNIQQKVPNWSYDNFAFSDTLPKGFEVAEAKIYQGKVSDGVDVTDNFTVNISSDKRTITATAKKAFREGDSFAGRTYNLRLSVNVSRKAASSGTGRVKYAKSAFSYKDREGNNATYNLVDFETGDEYLRFKNNATTDFGSTGTYTTNDTDTFLKIPNPPAPIKAVKDADEGFHQTGNDYKNVNNTLTINKK